MNCITLLFYSNFYLITSEIKYCQHLLSIFVFYILNSMFSLCLRNYIYIKFVELWMLSLFCLHELLLWYGQQFSFCHTYCYYVSKVFCHFYFASSPLHLYSDGTTFSKYFLFCELNDIIYSRKSSCFKIKLFS